MVRMPNNWSEKIWIKLRSLVRNIFELFFVLTIIKNF